MVTILQGDCIDVLKTMPDGSVNCCVTSPPYWSLRNYGEDAASIWGGESDCEHEWGDSLPAAGSRSNDEKPGAKQTKGATTDRDKRPDSQFCQKCGAWFGQLGLEPHPGDYEVEVVLMELRDDLTEEQRNEVTAYFGDDA